MTKLFKKMGREGTYLNIVKAIYDKPTANIIFNGEKLKAFPLISGTRQGCLLFTIIIQRSPGSPSDSNQRRKRNKRNPDQKRRWKLSLFAGDMILYIENPKDSIRKPLEVSVNLTKLQDTKSIHRNHLHFYILTMKNQKEKLRNQPHSPLQQNEFNI